MIGAFIGDLAAWTWKNDHDMFYTNLFSDRADRSEYSESMRLIANMLIENLNVSRAEFIPIFKVYLDTYHNFVTEDKYALMCSIAIGWLYDSPEDISRAINYCPCGDKEEIYTSHFLAQLIYLLRNGATKNEAVKQAEFIGTFHSFVQDSHWCSGKGSLGNLIRAWKSFYDAFDFGSAIHNAVKLPGDITFNCMLVGALADAMYGCETYFVKKQYKGGRDIERLSFLDDKLYEINHTKRTFFPKNNARTNVDKHNWISAQCPFEDKIISAELRRRILRAFYTGWEDRYGFYLDDGWIYVYRSSFLLCRFTLAEHADNTYRVKRYQISGELKGGYAQNNALREALYSVEYHWAYLNKE
jgi:hypothetical protein